jgi:Flp pilus assembly pilin Flp
MRHVWCKFLAGTDGQDLIEYSLLLAMVALASAALMMGAGHGVQRVWELARKVLYVAQPVRGG